MDTWELISRLCEAVCEYQNIALIIKVRKDELIFNVIPYEEEGEDE